MGFVDKMVKQLQLAQLAYCMCESDEQDFASSRTWRNIANELREDAKQRLQDVSEIIAMADADSEV